MQLQPFRVLVDALAVPVYTTLHYLGRGACKDYVRLVEPFGNDAAPTYNAVVGDSHILASVSYTHLTLPTILRV